MARVGEKELLQTDVQSIFTSDLTPQDSVKILESYVDMWVKKQLKVQEAERLFRSSNADIERMVEDYRNSLLIHRLDQYYVDNRLDTLFTDTEITAYYDAHKNDFILDRAIVRGRIVAVPENYRQRSQLRELMTASGEKLQDFTDICQKNNFSLTEFNTWTDWTDFISRVPVSRLTEAHKEPQPEKVVEIKDGDLIYLICVSDVRRPGDMNPLERVKEVIKRVIFNQRKLEIIRTYEDSIYNAAVNDRTIEINVN